MILIDREERKKVVCRLQNMQRIANVNFYMWGANWKMLTIYIVMQVFSIWNLSGVLDFAASSCMGVVPWILPHYYVMPIMQMVFGFLLISYFSDAPFYNRFTPFQQIRVGKRDWINGQILYILEASLAFVFLQLLSILLPILPQLAITGKWGRLITYLAYHPNAPSEYGIQITGMAFSEYLVENFSAVKLTLLCIGLLWAVSVFLGFLIFSIQIIFGNRSGMLAAGLLVFLAYFSNMWGEVFWGYHIFWFSPVNWISPLYVDLKGNGEMPGLWYVCMVLGWGSFLLAEVGKMVYMKREELPE